jgi:methyl-accepting chemotaxis protein
MLGNANVGTKIVLGFLVMIALLIVMGFVGYGSTKNIRNDVEKIVSERLPSLDYLLQADRDLQQLLVAERSMIFANAKSDVFKDLVAEYEQNLEQADTRFKKYKALAHDPEELAVIPKYEQAKGQWIEITRKIVEGRKADTRAGRRLALDLSLGEAKDKFEAMRDYIDQLTGINQKMAQDTSANSKAVYESSVLKIIVITAVAVILGLIISFLLKRGIAYPLVLMSKAAKVVADSKFQDLSSIPPDTLFRGELSTLHAALKSMVGQARAALAEAEEQTKEAEARSLEAQQAMNAAEQAKQQAEQAKTEGMNAAAEQLSGIVERVTSAAEELSAQVEQSSRGAETQRERAGEAATAMEEMNASVLEVARNASSAAENANSAKTTAEDGEKIVEKVVASVASVQEQAGQMKESLGDLGNQAEGIGEIMNVITDIADQTNLLALNAAIEAARAGDAGRGFAVVADEVRKLAEKTMSATKEVGTVVSSIQEGTRNNIRDMDKTYDAVGESAELVNEAGGTLREIVGIVETTSDQVRGIATASEEQSAASEEINRGTEEISRISSETSEAMNQSARAVSEMAELSQELQRLIEELRQT